MGPSITEAAHTTHGLEGLIPHTHCAHTEDTVTISLADMTYDEQLYELRTILPNILAALPRPAPTSVVAAKVARELNCEPSLASALMMRLAGEFGATHDGDVIHRYGKRMQRWRWHPSAPAAAGVEPETPEAYRARVTAAAERSQAITEDDW